MKKSDMKAVKLGLYGCGNRTKMMLDSLYGEGEYEVVSAFDVKEASTDALCKKYGGKACRTAEEMLGAKGVEAVIISLDPFSHPDAFAKTLQLGKPIFIEKPIAPTARQAYQMMLEAQKRKIPVHVGLLYRYLPTVRAVKKHLEENDPGRLFSITWNWHHAGETEIINMHNMFPNNFRLKISQIPFHCCHALDTICLLAGEIRSVHAYGIKCLEREYASPDEVIAVFEFQNGAIGHFHYSGVAFGSNGMPCCLHAENYTIAFSQWSTYDVWTRPPRKCMRGDLGKEDCRPTWEKFVGPAHHEFKTDGYMVGTIAAMSDFLASVRTGSPMKVPIETGVRTAEIADAIEMSYKSGKKVDLPLRFD